MNKKLQELIDKRLAAVTAMRAITDKAEAEGRTPTETENAKFDEIDADVIKYTAEIDRLELVDKLEKRLSATSAPERPNIGDPADPTKEHPAYAKAFRDYLRGGLEAVAPEHRMALQTGFRSAITDNPQTITTTGGGYLIPQGFSGQLEEAMLQYASMLTSGAEVFDTDSGNPLPWPTLDDTSNKGRLLAINTQVTNTPLVFSQVNFGAYVFSSDQVLVPFQLQQDSAFNLDAKLAAWLGERLGRIMNDYFTTGAGSTEPKGIVTCATLGKTGASGQVGTSGHEIIYDDLVDLEHSVDPAYRPGAKFMMHDSMLKALKKLKDSSGRPLWQPGLTASFGSGAQNTILDYPYVINQSMAAPGTTGSPVVGNKSLLFGNLSKFKIRRVRGTTVLRLTERYADYLQVGYFGYCRYDSNIVDAGTHPIKYYINAAS